AGTCRLDHGRSARRTRPGPRGTAGPEACTRSHRPRFPSTDHQSHLLQRKLKRREEILADPEAYRKQQTIQAGLLHHHRKSMNIKELRIRTWVNASDCPARSYAQSVAPGAVSSLLQATCVDQEKQRKSCPYKDLCLYC